MQADHFKDIVLGQVMRYSHVATDLGCPIVEEVGMQAPQVGRFVSPSPPPPPPGIPSVVPKSADLIGLESNRLTIAIDVISQRINNTELAINTYDYSVERRQRSGEMASVIKTLRHAAQELSEQCGSDTATNPAAFTLQGIFDNGVEGRATGLRNFDSKLLQIEADIRHCLDQYNLINSYVTPAEILARVEDKLMDQTPESNAVEQAKVVHLQRELASLYENIEKVRMERDASEANFLELFEKVVERLAKQLHTERSTRIAAHEKLEQVLRQIPGRRILQHPPPVVVQQQPLPQTTLKLPPSTLFTHLFTSSHQPQPQHQPLAVIDPNSPDRSRMMGMHPSKQRTVSSDRKSRSKGKENMPRWR